MRRRVSCLSWAVRCWAKPCASSQHNSLLLSKAMCNIMMSALACQSYQKKSPKLFKTIRYKKTVQSWGKVGNTYSCNAETVRSFPAEAEIKAWFHARIYRNLFTIYMAGLKIFRKNNTGAWKLFGSIDSGTKINWCWLKKKMFKKFVYIFDRFKYCFDKK